jgi:hypothetical protein
MMERSYSEAQKELKAGALAATRALRGALDSPSDNTRIRAATGILRHLPGGISSTITPSESEEVTIDEAIDRATRALVAILGSFTANDLATLSKGQRAGLELVRDALDRALKPKGRPMIGKRVTPDTLLTTRGEPN